MCALFVKEANKIPEVLDINSNMVNAKLTIKNEMSAIDTKNRTWYNSPTDDEKKKVGIWVLMRYCSSVKNNVKDIEEHYLEFTNEIVNVHSQIH